MTDTSNLNLQSGSILFSEDGQSLVNAEFRATDLTDVDIASLIDGKWLRVSGSKIVQADGVEPEAAEDVARNEMNIMLNASRIASGTENLVDGRVNPYKVKDEGIDTGNSSGYRYDADGDCYKPFSGMVLDNMEYADDAAAQSAYESSEVTTYSSDKTSPGVGTLTVSSTLSGDKANVINNNTNSAWRSNSVANQWWKIDLGAGNEVTATKFRICNIGGIQGGNSLLKGYKLEGSNNDSDWTLLCSNTYPNGQGWQDNTFANTTAYRYFKITSTSANWTGGDGIWIEEIEIMETEDSLQCYSESTIKQQGSYSLKTMAEQTNSLGEALVKLGLSLDLSEVNDIAISNRASRTGTNLKLKLQNSGGYDSDILSSGLTTAVSSTQSGSAAQVIDGNTNSEWRSANASGGQWWRVDLGSGVKKIINKMRVWNTGGFHGGNSLLKDYSLQASNDASTWTTLAGNTFPNSPIGSQETTFSNNTLYRYYRIYTNTLNYGNTYDIWLDEVELYEYTTHEKSITITSSDTWETTTWDLSAIADSDKNSIYRIVVEITNADADNTIYLDSFRSDRKNMTLQSDTISAEGTVNKMRVAVGLEEVDSITINTDFKVEATADGTNWEEITLIDEGDYSGSRKFLSNEHTFTNTGTTPKIRLKSLNNKDLCSLPNQMAKVAKSSGKSVTLVIPL